MKSATSGRNIEVVMFLDHHEFIRCQIVEKYWGRQSCEGPDVGKGTPAMLHQLWLTLIPETTLYLRSVALCHARSMYLATLNDVQCQCMYIWKSKRDTVVQICHTDAEALCGLYRAFEDSQGPFKTTSTPHSATADLFFVVGKSEISET